MWAVCVVYNTIYGAPQKWETHAGNPLSMGEKEGEKKKNQELLTTYINVCKHIHRVIVIYTVIVPCNSSGVNPELLLAAAESQIKHTMAVVGYSRVRIGFTSTGHKNDLPCTFLALFS